MKKSISVFVLLAAFVFSNNVHADVCDYKPSKLAGEAASAIAAGVGGSVVVAGAGMKAAGFYTLVHAGSGLTMLGSTAVGTSAAGTVGIMAGTAGAAGTVAAILMAPVTIAVGAATAVAVGGFEAACYFQVDRVTDPKTVESILISVAQHDASVAVLPDPKGLVLRLGQEKGSYQYYLVENLYIADGHLKHDDWFLDTDLGAVVLNIPESKA